MKRSRHEIKPAGHDELNARFDFELCKQDFYELTAPVSHDPLGQKTIADLVSAALFELDLQEAGNQNPSLTSAQIKQLKTFVAKWGR